MSKVILDMAMSLDGFIAGPNGEDHGLHDYFFSPAGNTVGVLEEGFKNTGAIIMGRKTYELGASQQDGFVDDPYHVPNFVLTSQAPVNPARGAETFIFVTSGIDSAVEQARAVAGDRDIVV
jgi:dihydrofolate reductase